MPRLQKWRLQCLEGFLRASRRIATRLGRAPRLPAHLELGQLGEEAAYLYLRRQGAVVVARGWRSGKAPGDLDLIAWDGPALCFVEVKTRTSRKVATAESAVDENKMRALRRLARLYLRSLPEQPEQIRFDVLSIYFEDHAAPDFQLYRNAFAWH